MENESADVGWACEVVREVVWFWTSIIELELGIKVKVKVKLGVLGFGADDHDQSLVSYPHLSMPDSSGGRHSTLLTSRKRSTERRQTPPKTVQILVQIILICTRRDNARRGIGGCGAETRPVAAAAARRNVRVPEGLQAGCGADGRAVDVLLDCRVVSGGHDWLGLGGGGGWWEDSGLWRKGSAGGE